MVTWFLSPVGQQPPVGQDLLIIEVSRSHWDTTIGRTPLHEWSAWRRDLYLTTQNSQETDVHAAGGIRTSNPIKRVVAALDRVATGVGQE